MKTLSRYLLLLLFCGSCYRVADNIEPRVDYRLQDRHFHCLKGAFEPLTEEERRSDWGKECVIARAFADELDLYRAVSTFKRAAILIGAESKERKLEVQYDIVFCYFLGKRYDEVIETFEKSGLSNVDKSFAAYHDLLLMLYEAYHEVDEPDKQTCILELIDKSFPETGEKLRLSAATRQGDICQMQLFAAGFPEDSYLDSFLDCYHSEKKSVAKAQLLNAIVPGAGYLYIGQRGSAITAFLLNSLFIVAAYEFFHHGHTAAGIITTLFESGWYFGGIYGAGEEAKYYNERIYEQNASCLLNEQNLFPVLMMQYAF